MVLPALLCWWGANLYSHFGKQYSTFSEKWESIYLKMQLYHSQRMFNHTTRKLCSKNVLNLHKSEFFLHANHPGITGSYSVLSNKCNSSGVEPTTFFHTVCALWIITDSSFIENFNHPSVILCVNIIKAIHDNL